MSETTAVNTIARERVDTLAARNHEPDWLKSMRLRAWEAYLETPEPTRRDDEWRKIDIDSLDMTAMVALDGATTPDAKVKLPKWLEPALANFPNAHVVGEVATGSHSCTLPNELLQKGVIFCSLQEALTEHADLVRPFLERPLSETEDGRFGLMNKALFNSGAFLYVPDGVEIDDLFVSVTDISLTDKHKDLGGVAVFPRIVVSIGAHSQANLLNIFSSETASSGSTKADSGSGSSSSSSGSGYSLADVLVEVHIGAGAYLRYVEVQKYGNDVFVVTKTRSDVGKDGQFSSLTAGLGGGQLKSDIVTALNASGATSDIEGVVLGDGHEHFNFNTILEHNAPDTRSNLNFRVALKDSASSVYQGIIKVAKVAQKTDAYQSNKNLLLGTEARADSIPKLEILADDVKCSHGATVGPVDREQVFYLMSRGLTANEAEKLIVTGFFRQVLETCTIVGASNWITDLVTEKIHGV